MEQEINEDDAVRADDDEDEDDYDGVDSFIGAERRKGPRMVSNEIQSCVLHKNWSHHNHESDESSWKFFVTETNDDHNPKVDSVRVISVHPVSKDHPLILIPNSSFPFSGCLIQWSRIQTSSSCILITFEK